ncbi:nuclear receptor ROR-alpha A-like [Ptychodera flava]|uniref:nuclear receptor ROR-alpha A-like n=1 Tax=Ptychodera flava TaxID=63121 RepID=UPI003969EAE0
MNDRCIIWYVLLVIRCNMASDSGVVERKAARKKGKRSLDSYDNNGNTDPTLRQCWVCGEYSSTYHYGVVACDGCKSFFSRSQSLYKTYQCVGKECVVNKFTRNQCQYCRWVKCQAVGMSKEACKLGRRSKKLKAAMKEKSKKLLNSDIAVHESASQLRQKPLVNQVKGQEIVNVVHPFRIETKDSSLSEKPIKVDCTESLDEVPFTSVKKSTARSASDEENPIKMYSCCDSEQSDNTEGHAGDSNTNDEDSKLTETPQAQMAAEISAKVAKMTARAESKPPPELCEKVLEGMTLEEVISWLEKCQYESFMAQHLRDQAKFCKAKEKAILSKQQQRKSSQNTNSKYDQAPSEYQAEGLHFDKEQAPCQTSPLEMPQTPFETEGLSPSRTWQYVSQSFTVLIEGVVTFAKRLPAFKTFDIDDRMTIIKAGCFEVVLVRLSMLYHLPYNSMTFFGTDMEMSLEQAQRTPMGVFVTGMFEFCSRINSLHLKDTEKALLSAVTLMSADRPGLKNKELVSSMQEVFLQALQHELMRNHADDETLLSQVLLLLPKLRELNFEHNKKLMEMKINQDIKFPLLHEEVFET